LKSWIGGRKGVYAVFDGLRLFMTMKQFVILRCALKAHLEGWPRYVVPGLVPVLHVFILLVVRGVGCI
jgi:hypothetical protein